MIEQEWIDIAEIEGAARSKLHIGHPTRRALSDGYDLVGLLGEVAFARAFRLALDLDRKPKGDGGVDFVMPLKFSVDVKTARKAVHLIHEKGKPIADIYVLAEYSDEGPDVKLIGWEWGKVLAAAPVRDFGHGVLSHFIHHASLRPMDQLAERIARIT